MIFLELWFEKPAELGFPPPQVAKQYVVASSEQEVTTLFPPCVAAMMKRREVSEEFVRTLPLDGHCHEASARGMTLVDYAKMLVESGWPGMHLGTLNR